jgi:glycosyltransferase involved in cell wall biosynthesis
MKVIILLTYYNRPYQLTKTIESIFKTRHDDYNIIILDDASIVPYDSEHLTIREEVKTHVMNIPLYNKGIQTALDMGADIIMLQNAECIHYGDVISYAVENLSEYNYLSFACFSLSRDSTYKKNLDADKLVKENHVCATDSEKDSWYNHPELRGVGYDFCSAVTRDNIIRLNGFDERYASGFCYADDDLVMRIKRLGLHIEIPTDPFVLHQWHGGSMGIRDDSLQVQNRELYLTLGQEKDIRAKHIHTEDLHG